MMDRCDLVRRRSLGAVGLLCAAVTFWTALFGMGQLVDSFGMDQGSPAPAERMWPAVAGLAAGCAVVGVWWILGQPNVRSKIATAAVVAMVLCSVPIWRRDSTIDVAKTGFHQAVYDFETRDFRLYNATGVPIRVCLGASGVCQADTDDASRLKAPGLALDLSAAAWVNWLGGAYGTFKLTVAGPPSMMSRPDTELRIRERPPPSTSQPDPFPPDPLPMNPFPADPFPYQGPVR